MIVSDYSKIDEQERSWHRRHAVWRARKAGAEPEDIARVLGVKPAQVCRMWERANREVRDQEVSPLEGELSTVEVVSFPQLCHALSRTVLSKRNEEISNLKAMLKVQIADLKSAKEEIRRLRLRVMDDILIVRDGHFIGSRPHKSGLAFIRVFSPNGGIEEFTLYPFCARDGHLVHHALVVFDNARRVAPEGSDVPPPFNAWCVGGQTLPALAETQAPSSTP